MGRGAFGPDAFLDFSRRRAGSRPLGDRQQAVLRALQQHGSWSERCGWAWDGEAVTMAILDSLVARGLARVTVRTRLQHGYEDRSHRYTLSPAGVALLAGGREGAKKGA